MDWLGRKTSTQSLNWFLLLFFWLFSVSASRYKLKQYVPNTQHVHLQSGVQALFFSPKHTDVFLICTLTFLTKWYRQTVHMGIQESGCLWNHKEHIPPGTTNLHILKQRHKNKNLGTEKYGIKCPFFFFFFFSHYSSLDRKGYQVILISTHTICCATHEKGPYTSCGQCRSRSACASVQSELRILCLSTYTIVSIDSVSEQCRPRSAWAYAQANLGQHCPHIA